MILRFSIQPSKASGVYEGSICLVPPPGLGIEKSTGPFILAPSSIPVAVKLCIVKEGKVSSSYVIAHKTSEISRYVIPPYGLIPAWELRNGESFTTLEHLPVFYTVAKIESYRATDITRRFVARQDSGSHIGNLSHFYPTADSYALVKERAERPPFIPALRLAELGCKLREELEGFEHE